MSTSNIDPMTADTSSDVSAINVLNAAIMKLRQYGVKLTYDSSVQENRGYIFTPSTINASPEESAHFQKAIKIVLNACESHNGDNTICLVKI